MVANYSNLHIVWFPYRKVLYESSQINVTELELGAHLDTFIGRKEFSTGLCIFKCASGTCYKKLLDALIGQRRMAGP